MATYREQLEEARSYRLREGGSYRGNCPFCSGRNTYGVALRQGVLIWGCFKASCDVAGRWDGGMSMEGLKSRLRASEGATETLQVTPIPPLVSIRNREPIRAFLERYNSWQAYDMGLIDIKYAPTEDRIMFPTQNKAGYNGRARQGVFPKWKKFGDCGELLTCGNGKIGVVVEDALSACAVGPLENHVGVSLSGTILSKDHIVALREYDKIIVCLDPDARSKGLNMASRIGSTASIRNIPNDLKYYSTEQIKEILYD